VTKADINMASKTVKFLILRINNVNTSDHWIYLVSLPN